MRFLGYSTFKLKWIGFTLASLLSSLSGALFAINFGFVNPNLGNPGRAADVLVATLIGGSGTVYGPFFGSLAFLGIRDIVSKYIVRWELMVGILTIIVLFRFRKGVWGNVELFLLEKYGKKRKTPMNLKLSCQPDPKGDR
jgi:branched-chain amino acid transport system permease protein